MQHIIIIGTVHDMLPKHKNELKAFFEKTDPDQVLVEIDREIDLESNEIKKYPKEMVFAYNWGVRNNKKVDVFDTNRYDNQTKRGVTKKNLKEAEKELFNIFKGYNWKEMNDIGYHVARKYQKIVSKIIDRRKLRARRIIMLNNIRKLAIRDGTILILTGASHLDFFHKHLKKAAFPFR